MQTKNRLFWENGKRDERKAKEKLNVCESVECVISYECGITLYQILCVTLMHTKYEINKNYSFE